MLIKVLSLGLDVLFAVLNFRCLSSSVDATWGKTKLSNIILGKSLSTIVRSQSIIGFVLSGAAFSPCDYSELLLFISSPASFLSLKENSGAIESNVTSRHFL